MPRLSAHDFIDRFYQAKTAEACSDVILDVVADVEWTYHDEVVMVTPAQVARLVEIAFHEGVASK